MRGSVILCVIGVVCASVPFAAGLEVREEAIHVHFANHAARIQFEVSTDSASSVRLLTEWLDTQDQVVSQASTSAAVKPGTQTLSILTASPITPYKGANEALALTLRLRYSLTGGEVNMTRIVSLSDLRSNYIVLAPLVPDTLSPAHPLKFAVRALDPRGLAIEAAVVNAKVRFAEKHTVKASAKTDASGKAAFIVPWPEGIPRDEMDSPTIEVEAISGDVHRSYRTSVDVDSTPTLYVSTDKALYQPGQTLHMRGIAFDELGKAMAEGKLELKVHKGRGETVYHTIAKASRFGIVVADWVIPESTETGDYSVELTAATSNHSSTRLVRISHYELPTFEFTAKPSRDHAGPGESVGVTIDAKYLFGAPLKSGKVKLAGQATRYRDNGGYQSMTPEVPAEAVLDEHGHAELELTIPEFEDGTPPWSLSYTATVTEPDTQREEERTFTVYLTAGNIQVTFAGTGPNRLLRASLLSGKPCSPCTVELYAYSYKYRARKPRKGAEVKVGEVTTNALGVGEIRAFHAPKMEPWADTTMLRWQAAGPDGNNGGGTGYLSEDSEIEGAITTARVIYSPGEPVHLSVNSPKASAVLIGVAREYRMLDTFQVALQNGHAEFDYPYATEFADSVTFVLAAADPEEDGGRAIDQLTVFYRTQHSLKIDVRMDRSVYRPGDKVRAAVDVRTIDGKPVEAALGVSAIDRAVILRAMGGAEVKDDIPSLPRLMGLAKLTPEQESLARFFSRELHFWQTNIDHNFDVGVPFQSAFQLWLRSRFAPYTRAVDAAVEGGAPVPGTEQTLKEIWRSAGLDWDRLKDPWGAPFNLHVVRNNLNVSCVVSTQGNRLSYELFNMTWFKRQETKLRAYLAKALRFPTNDAEFEVAWQAAGLTPADRIDPWGDPVKTDFGMVPQLGTATFAYAEYKPKEAKRNVEYGSLRRMTLYFLSNRGYKNLLAEFTEAHSVIGKNADSSQL